MADLTGVKVGDRLRALTALAEQDYRRTKGDVEESLLVPVKESVTATGLNRKQRRAAAKGVKHENA